MAARVETGGVGTNRCDTYEQTNDATVKNNLEKINILIHRLNAKTSIDLEAIIASSKKHTATNKGIASKHHARRLKESANMLRTIIASIDKVSERLKLTAYSSFRPQEEVLKLAENTNTEFIPKKINISFSIDGILPDCLKGYYELMQKVTRLLMENSAISYGNFVSVNVRLMPAFGSQQQLLILITASRGKNETVVIGASPDTIIYSAFTALHEIISVCGGGLKMQLDPEKNPIYEISLPFSDCTANEANEVNSEAADARQPAILLVDDIQVNQLIVSRVLANTSASLDWAVNGKEALEMIRNKKYDLILMDLEMPEMNGFETTARIREGGAGETSADVPVIALTSSNTIHARKQALAAGINAFIAKPAHREELYEEISKYLTL